jgi:hypothetical protein
MTEREAFEAWFIAQYVYEDIAKKDLFRYPLGLYIREEVQDQWEAWQASRKQALEESAAACISLRDQIVAAQEKGDDRLENVMLRQVAELGCAECARAIRSLTPTPSKGQP